MGACSSKNATSKDMGAAGGGTQVKAVFVPKAPARSQPLFDSASPAASKERQQPIMSLADLAKADTQSGDFMDAGNHYGDSEWDSTLRSSASQKMIDVHNVDEVRRSPRHALTDNPSRGHKSGNAETKTRWKGAVSTIIKKKNFGTGTGTAEMAAAPYEAVDTSPAPPYARVASTPLTGGKKDPASPTAEKKSEKVSSWGKLRGLVSLTSPSSKRSTFPAASAGAGAGAGAGVGAGAGADIGAQSSETGSPVSPLKMETSLPDPIPDSIPPSPPPVSPPLARREGDSFAGGSAVSSPGVDVGAGGGGVRTRFVEFQRLRALPEHALFEELARCPGLTLSAQECEDTHAVCVAIVKFRFDGYGGSDGAGAGAGAGAGERELSPAWPPPYYPVSSPEGGVRVDLLSDEHYLPRQGATLMHGGGAPSVSVAGGQGLGRGAPRARPGAGAERNLDRGALTTSARIKLGMSTAAAAATTITTASAAMPTPRQENTFFAEDMGRFRPGIATGDVEGSGNDKVPPVSAEERAAREREQGWRYSGAVAKDAKNVLSQVKLGKSDLPTPTPTSTSSATAGAGGGGGGGGGGMKSSARKGKGSHWDAAVRVAKAKSALKATRGERPPGGGVTQARVAKYHAPLHSTSSPGGWLSELAEVEKDVQAAKKLRVSRARQAGELREQQHRVIDEVIGRLTPPVGSPLTLSSLERDTGAGAGTGTGTGTSQASHYFGPGSTTQSTQSGASPDSFDAQLRSTLYSKRVRMKPSLSDSTRGARAAAVNTAKVCAPSTASTGPNTGVWKPRSKLRPIESASQLSSEAKTNTKTNTLGTASSEHDDHGHGDDDGEGGAKNGHEERDLVGMGFTGRRHRDHSLFLRSAAIKEAVSKANKVSAEVKRAQVKKGIRSDGGAVGIFS